MVVVIAHQKGGKIADNYNLNFSKDVGKLDGATHFVVLLLLQLIYSLVTIYHKMYLTF